VSSKLLLKQDDNCVVPGIVKILLGRRDVNLLAGAATVGVGRCMERLMYIGYEMDQKREVAGGAPFIVVAIAKSTSILVDFGRDAISARALRWQIVLVILKADVDVMPRCRRAIFAPELSIRPN
jgi:hypothetical protein